MKRAWLWLVVLGLGLLVVGFYGKSRPLGPASSASLERARERAIKKVFGAYYKDRFQGYHTGVDFEIFPEETDVPVSIQAICSGKLRLKESASGYGGVVVQDCERDNQPITVVYGHLKLASVTKNPGDELVSGDIIGTLGAAQSQETDGERKHLHLGIHKGSSVDIRGYVASSGELSAWLDPCPDDKMAAWNICSQ